MVGPQSDGYESADPNRNINNTLRMNLRCEKVRMDPEYLESDELRYELYLRGLALCGTSRDRTGRVASALKEENRTNKRPQRSHMLLATDVAQSVVKLAQVQNLIATLTLDEAHVKRLGTMLAHLEGRAGRMFPENAAHGTVVRDLGTQIEGYIHLFLDKFEELKQRRGRAAPVASAEATSSFTVSSGFSDALIDLTKTEESVGDASGNPPSSDQDRPRADATYDVGGKPTPVLSISEKIGRPGTSQPSVTGHGQSTVWSNSWMPTEAMFSSFPPATTLTSEQLRALERTFDSNYDGASFVDDWSYRTRAHSTQSSGRGTVGSDQRNVRFQVDGEQPKPRDETKRDIVDTPFPANQNLVHDVPAVRYGRYSDASSKSSRSGRSNRSGDTTLGERSEGSPRHETPRGYRNAGGHADTPIPNTADVNRAIENRHPANETYILEVDPQNEQNRTGQYIFIPDDAPIEAAHDLTGGMPGRFVFIPYTEPDPWRLIATGPRPRAARNGAMRPDPTPVVPPREQNPAQRNRNAPNNDNVRGENGGNQAGQFMRLRSKMIPIHNWQLNFSGEDKLASAIDLRINEFLYQIEVNKHAQHISDEEMLGQISTLLTGTARTWYYAYYRSFRNWGHFVESMRNRFLSPFHELDALDEISQRKQGKTEPVMSFLNHMVMLFQTVSQDVDEGYMAHIIQRNLRPEFQAHVGPWEPRNLTELERILARLQPNKIHVAPEVEKKPFFRRIVAPKVSEVEASHEQDEEVIQITEEELMALLRDRKPRSAASIANAPNRSATATSKDAATQAIISVAAGSSTKTSEVV